MSIFKTIADSDIALYVDFRSGSGIDISGNYTTSIGANGYLVHKKLYSANTLGLVSSANVALNKSDFTIIAKHRTVTKLNGHFYTFGTGNDRGLLLYNNVLQTRIDSTYYTETLVGTKYDAGGEFVSYGFSADRDANGQFYVNGVAVGTAKNISAKANYDINYSTPILTTYTENTFETQYVLLLKKALTATEMAQLTAELESKKWTSKIKSRANAKNILVDGDMKMLGVTEWNTTAATLTKIDDVKRWLRVTNTVNNGQATQRPLTAGKTYRVTGYAVGDGTARPRVYLGNGVYVFIGAAGTDIQYINTTFTATDNYFSLMAYGASGAYCDFANIQISEVGSDEVFYKTENGIRADQKSSIVDNKLSNTDFIASDTTFKVNDDTFNGEDVKALEYTHVSIGDYVYIPSSSMNLTPTQAAYGEWKFWFKKSTGSCTLRAGIIQSQIGIPSSGTNNGYYVYVGAITSLNLVKVVNGVATTQLITGTPITDTEYHEIKLTRTSAGVFELFVDNVSQGTATDTLHTTSNYMVFNPEGSSSKIILSSERGTYGIIKK